MTLENDKIVLRVSNYLNHPLRIHLNDGRTVIGHLSCLDDRGNIILDETTEYRHCPHKETKDHIRNLGMTLILASHVSSCQIYSSKLLR